MNPFEFVLIIIAMSFGMALIIKKMELGERRRRHHQKELGTEAATDQENRRLREELSEMKERLHVLERIATDKENRLSQEIESLRER
jgi:5-bromo-4-chloroindolyl phosphate hydrolysis protein